MLPEAQRRARANGYTHDHGGHADDARDWSLYEKLKYNFLRVIAKLPSNLVMASCQRTKFPGRLEGSRGQRNIAPRTYGLLRLLTPNRMVERVSLLSCPSQKSRS